MVSIKNWMKVEALFDRPHNAHLNPSASDLVVDLHKRVVALDERVKALERRR